jgi:hypothetical protein
LDSNDPISTSDLTRLIRDDAGRPITLACARRLMRRFYHVPCGRVHLTNRSLIARYLLDNARNLPPVRYQDPTQTCLEVAKMMVAKLMEDGVIQFADGWSWKGLKSGVRSQESVNGSTVQEEVA